MSSDPYELHDPYAVTDRSEHGAGGISYHDMRQPEPYEHTTFSKSLGEGGKDSARGGGTSFRVLESAGRPLSPLSGRLRDAQGAAALDDGQMMQGWLYKLYGEGSQAQWKRHW